MRRRSGGGDSLSLAFFFYKHDTIRDKEKTTEDRTGQGLSSLLVSYLVTRLNFV